MFSFIWFDKRNKRATVWNSTDAELLFSIAVWNKDGKQLSDILFAGKLLANKKFSLEELRDSISKLLYAGLIHNKEMLFFTTEEGKKIFDQVSELSTRSPNQILHIAKKLQSVKAVTANNDSCRDFLTPEIWNESVEVSSSRLNALFSSSVLALKNKTT